MPECSGTHPVGEGDRALTIMIAESSQPDISCARRTQPHRFTPAQWQMAIAAAGGMAVAEPLLRASHQACLARPWSEHESSNIALTASAELAAVIHHLSGRLGPP